MILIMPLPQMLAATMIAIATMAIHQLPVQLSMAEEDRVRPMAMMMMTAAKREAAELLFSQGCKLLLVTRGAGGAAVYTPNASAETKALPVTVADTTGAGDSFIGSFLYQLTRDGVTAETLADIPQKKLADYLTFSSECSAYTVQHKGAVMPTEEELRMKNG